MRKYEGGVGPLADSIIDTVLNSNGFVLELGAHTGEGSTAMIQEGLEYHPDPLHISVDWDDQLTAHRPKVPWWYLVVGDTRDMQTLVEALIISGDRDPGVIFIDTDHNYDQMKAELELWGSLATKETVWLFHDTHLYGTPNVEMTRAIKEYAESHDWIYDDWRQDSHGLGRMRQ
jgi:hypothetical protein